MYSQRIIGKVICDGPDGQGCPDNLGVECEDVSAIALYRLAESQGWKRVSAPELRRRNLDLCPRCQARRHHLLHGEMDGVTCLLAKCALHYPGRE